MPPRITKIQIHNFKSIGQANVDLGPFTILVGPNGAGKSNFLDVIPFVQECLSGTVELALKNRGGIGAVRRRSGGHPTHIEIRLDMELELGRNAMYAFEISAKPGERFRIAREKCAVWENMAISNSFELVDGEWKTGIPGIRPRVTSDRLALTLLSGAEEFRPVYDFLTGMRLYSIVPDRLRELQEPDSGDSLKPDGSNAAAVLKRLADIENGRRYDRVCRLLSAIVEGVEKVEYHSVGQMETLQFRQDVGLKNPWKFEGLNMSDGTLRVLGLLLAVYQPGDHSVVAIEEPEATVHPAAAETLVEIFLDASAEKQILVTTHSPDLLDCKEISDDRIRIVTKEKNQTWISPVSSASRDAIRDRLYTPGELLRSNELNPDTQVSKMAAKQLSLFSELNAEIPR